MIRNKKYVTSGALIPGQKICGWDYDSGRGHCFSTAYVKEVNSEYVTLELFRQRSGDIKKVDASYIFQVEMTAEEYAKRWKPLAKQVCEALQNRLHRDEIGYHEMDNHWLRINVFEMADLVDAMRARVVGYCTDIIPKRSWLGEDLDVGVCVEYDNGERMWCHSKSSDIAEALEWYREVVGE